MISSEGLQESTCLLAHRSSYAGLRINAKKTQCMVINRCASQRPYIRDGSIELKIESEPLIKQFSNFVYLGVTISADGTIDSDLGVRMHRTNGAFHQLKNI